MQVTIYIISLCLIFCLPFCRKSEFLDGNPDQSLVTPETLDDLQAILDNDGIMNGNQIGTGVYPASCELGTDNYFLTASGLQTLKSVSAGYFNYYTWNDDVGGLKFYDWSFPYRAVFYSNVVLEGLNKITAQPSTRQIRDAIKGSALFFRGQMHFGIAQVFAPSYEQASAAGNRGIVIKLTADVNESIIRSDLAQTYQQIIKDLHEARALLPDLPIGMIKTRPSKTAALAMLARVYLSMKNYDSALHYADESLKLYDRLLNYNGDTGVNTTGTFSFARYNPEVIFHSMLVNATVSQMMGGSTIRVDSNLVKTYHANDLRSSKFFLNRPDGKFFKGSYDGSLYFFCGIACDEMYLIRSECYARKGMTFEALADLNALILTRWKNDGSFVPFTAPSSEDALAIVLEERRKELIFRGLRWTDLRRLNSEGANLQIDRVVDGQIYSLAPNSLKYTYLIPNDVMSFNPGMEQNAR